MSGQGWRTVKLGDIAELRWGDTSTTKASYVPTGFLAYSATGPDGFLDHFDHEGPGIVLSAIGAQCGKVWFATGRWSCIKNTIYVKGKPDAAETRYLYYVASTPDFWPRRGAAQPFISQGDARAIEIHLPPLAAQRSIATILGTYDDLIQVNQRRIAVLEEVSRRLFEEWFVHFRFPGGEAESGSASAKTQDFVPPGWRSAKLVEIFNFRSGNTISPEDRAGGRHAVYGANGVIGFTHLPPTSDRCMVLGKIGSCGALHRADSGAFVTNNAYAVEPALAATDFEFMALTLRSVPWRQYVGGAANPYMPVKGFANHEVLLPPAALRARFSEVVEPMTSLIHNLSKANQRLAESRDQLLTRLISGDLTVNAAERELESDA
jgi:hypothetical protein